METHENLLSPRERLLLLRSFFGGATMLPEVLYEMAATAREARFNEGDLIHHANEPARTSYFIVEGTVRMSLNGGAPYELHAPASGGFLSILAGMKDGMHMEASTDVFCLAHSASDIRQIMSRDPEQLINVLRGNASGLLRLTGYRAGFPAPKNVAPQRQLPETADFVDRLMLLRTMPMYGGGERGQRRVPRAFDIHSPARRRDRAVGL